MKQRVRKAHSKSRNGCLECKKRHHKCDECYPICGQCRRLKSPCSLKNKPSPDSSQSPAEGRTLNIEDLRLLHHWHNAGRSEDFAPFVDHAHVDHGESYNRIVDLSLRHPYLLHSLLALSALHMLHRDETADTDLFQLASAHQLSATRLARPQVARGDPEHRDAVFNFAAFSSLYAMAEPPLRTGDTALNTPSDVISALLDAFKMGKGIRAVLDPFLDELKASGSLNTEIWRVDDSDVAPTLEAEYPQMIALSTLVHEQGNEETQRKPCLEAVRSLFTSMGVFARNHKNHSSLRLIQTWAMDLDADCLEMFESHHPVGLILLAHYAVLIKMRDHYWFYHRWPRLLLEAVEGLLENQWHRYLEWPREMILGNCRGIKMSSA